MHTHTKEKGALTCSIPDLSTLLFELIVHDIYMEVVIQSIVSLYIYIYIYILHSCTWIRAYMINYLCIYAKLWVPFSWPHSTFPSALVF